MAAWLPICLGLGAALFGLGLPLGSTFPYIFSALIQTVFQLSPTAITFSQNSDSPVPIYMEIYLWNWTNAEDFTNDKTILPDFKEVGPFVFRLKSQRANVQWNDNHTVTFSPNRTFLFEPSLSLSLDTPVTALSPVPAVGKKFLYKRVVTIQHYYYHTSRSKT